MVPIEELLAGARQHRLGTGRPLVTLSYAQSLDGCIAQVRGQPAAISGPEALRMTHELRASHDAILVGVGTVLADDPRLNVRLVQGKDPRPLVLDPHLRIPLGANLLKDPARQPWIFTGLAPDSAKRQEIERLGARVIEVAGGSNGWIDLERMLGCLGELEIDRLMVEGGAHVISSFLAAGSVDRVVITIAPVFLGGLRAVEPMQPRPAGRPPRMQVQGWEPLGSDWVVWGKFNQEAA